jgi:hypothetical protein
MEILVVKNKHKNMLNTWSKKKKKRKKVHLVSGVQTSYTGPILLAMGLLSRWGLANMCQVAGLGFYEMSPLSPSLELPTGGQLFQ